MDGQGNGLAIVPGHVAKQKQVPPIKGQNQHMPYERSWASQLCKPYIYKCKENEPKNLNHLFHR